MYFNVQCVHYNKQGMYDSIIAHICVILPIAFITFETFVTLWLMAKS